MNVLGLTTQVPMNLVFLTDGSPRSIALFNGHKIVYKHTVPKKLSFQHQIAQLITAALQEIGREHITEEHKQQLKTILSPIKEEQIKVDYVLMPAWIRTLLKELYELILSTLLLSNSVPPSHKQQFGLDFLSKLSKKTYGLRHTTACIHPPFFG